MKSDEYFKVLKNYGQELKGLTEKVWENGCLNV